VIREEAWLFCRISSGVRLCWELEEPSGPKLSLGEQALTDIIERLPQGKKLEGWSLLRAEGAFRKFQELKEGEAGV